MKRGGIGVVALLAGCQPVYELAEERTCEHDVAAFDRGLLEGLLASEDGGTTFDYAPDDALRERVVGSYDLETGAFEITTTFVEGFWQTEARVSGQGTVWPDGDVDLEYTLTVDDIAGAGKPITVREVRLGCDTERTEYNPNGKVIRSEDGQIRAAAWVYDRDDLEEGVVATVAGRREATGVDTWETSWRKDDYEFVGTTVDDDEGKRTTDYDVVTPDTLETGRITRRFDGTVRRLREVERFNRNETWDVTLDVTEQDGEGDVTYEPLGGEAYVCDVIYEDGDCVVQCPGFPEEDC